MMAPFIKHTVYLPFICLLVSYLLATDSEEFKYDDGFRNPNAIGRQLTGPVVKFYFTSIQQASDLELFILEGSEYRSIRSAFQTIGSLHRVSKRNHVILYRELVQIVDGQERVRYEPAYQAALKNPDSSYLLVFTAEKGTQQKGSPVNLPIIDISEKSLLRNQLTFVNTFNRPLAIKIDDKVKMLAPHAKLHTDFRVNARGAGRVRLLLAVQEADGSARKLYDRKLVLSQGMRALAFPYLDPAIAGVNLLVHSFP